MLVWSELGIFIVAAIVLLVTPGPAVLYIIARSLDQGRLAGIVSVLGIQVGAIFHIIAAAIGISAILVSSALAFQIVKYLGAAYLVYLGIRKLMEKPTESLEDIEIENQPLSKIFRQGFIVNLLNPKTALFFFAFLPQFVDSNRGAVEIQFLLLGLIFIGLAMISDSIYAIGAGTLSKTLKQSSSVISLQKYLTGGIYITLGAVTAFAGGDGK